MENQLRCPKCNSTQLTTNKKGFSGKKAVAGAVLTGGIGLLAGTLGSNKIIITCLNCGKQFKPGEDYASTQKKILQQKQAMNGPGFWIFFLLIMGLFVFLFKSCFQSPDETKTDETKTNVAASAITNPASLSLANYYEIEKADNDESNIRLFLYVSDPSKISDINQFLISTDNSDKTKYMDVYYFDKKGIGPTYLEKQMDENISEKEKNRLYKHLIAVYKF